MKKLFASIIFLLLAALPSIATEGIFSFSQTQGVASIGVIADASGSTTIFYSAQQEGGSGAYNNNCGTVISFLSTGSPSILYNFGATSTDGCNPSGPPLEDSSGNLYGLTAYGGANGNGTLWKLTKSGGTYTESILHSFNGPYGGQPLGRLYMDSSSNLWGGCGSCGNNDNGGVFEYTSGGTYVFHEFPSSVSTCGPNAGVVQDTTLTTTTFYGVDCNVLGQVFKLTVSGSTWTYSAVYGFGNIPDVSFPDGELYIDLSTGDLYGTAVFGGKQVTGECGAGCGGVYKVKSNGTESVVYKFQGGLSDANSPISALFWDSTNSRFLGVANAGGSINCSGKGCGAVFSVTKTGTESILHTFTGPASDGANPISSPLIDTNTSYIWGVTAAGGNGSGCAAGGCGTAYWIH